MRASATCDQQNECSSSSLDVFLVRECAFCTWRIRCLYFFLPLVVADKNCKQISGKMRAQNGGSTRPFLHRPHRGEQGGRNLLRWRQRCAFAPSVFAKPRGNRRLPSPEPSCAPNCFERDPGGLSLALSHLSEMRGPVDGRPPVEGVLGC